MVDRKKPKYVNNKPLFGRVSIILSRPINEAYEYLNQEFSLIVGDIVQVSFRNRLVNGLVVGTGAGMVPETKLKPIIQKYNDNGLTREVLEFIYWVAHYNMTPVGAVLKMVLCVPGIFNLPKTVTAFSRLEQAPPSSLKMTSSREKVLRLLSEGSPKTLAEIKAATGVSDTVIIGLAKASAIERVSMEPELRIAPLVLNAECQVTLNSEQEAAAIPLRKAVQVQEFSVWLIDGITGSGKTEVYFEAVSEAIRLRLQVLILVPEIALSQPFLDRFQDRFGVRPVEWHSDLSAKKRRIIWESVFRGDVNVVIGARSSLFLPFPKLGLIIVDEEHEASFKQMEGVRYQCRDMAVVRAQITGIPTVLVSATPSLETLSNVSSGRYNKVSLTRRFGGAELPNVEVLDLCKVSNQPKRWISPKLKRAIEETLNRREQTLLFLNRRGYAPLNVCRSCGFRYECSSCSAWLVEHRSISRLQCHHCGYGIPTPHTCIECGTSGSLTAAGPGVERIEEEIFSLFPGARTRIASSDTLGSPEAAANLITAIKLGEVDIVIGTQVIAKGHHFPRITCVGVIDADLGLSGGDLRAGERTYQMLHQVAGRAGRENRKGKVWLQTRQPNNSLINALATWDREGFLDSEQLLRKEAGMPPYGRLVALIISSSDLNIVDRTSRLVAASAPYTPRAQILGPAPAPISFLRGRYRRRFLIKAEKNLNVQKMISNWLDKLKIPNNSKIEIDVDPYSFL